MMLVQKPHNILLATPAAYTHRRHPSAPVVVQPTRTPGLLSLSKPQQQPPKSTPQRQLPSQQRREAKPVPKSNKIIGVVRAQALAPAAEVGFQAPATPSPQSRGQAHAKHPKDKVQSQIPRSTSHSSLRAAKHGRQPSPPIPSQLESIQLSIPSQAEDFSIIKSTNLFDPFSDDNTHPSPPPSPTISKPIGKLARRRQQQQHLEPIAAPALSQAIPVPTTQRAINNNISRSDPLPSNMRPRPLPKRSSTTQEFPICDDMNEVGERAFSLSPPSTPRRSTHNGPRTAPVIEVPPFGFPFGKAASAEQLLAKRNRKHHRVPSEGVFNMSSDEEVSSGPGGVALSTNVQALFKMVNSAKRSSLPSTPAPLRSQGSSPYGSDSEGNEKAGYYASSMFQNSPSPEELPDPLLI